jgi:hypothetical protein
MSEPWELVARDVLAMLAVRAITPDQAASWLWSLVEFAEATDA